ncbi:MAG: response regulator [Nitrospirota bacterium]|nr:response regulator [Nitrospirota bacterium]
MLNKVLVVDDSPLIREMCRNMLKGRSREILSAGSGCEAFEMMKLHPDTELVLLDIHMPAVSGLAVLAAFKETEAFRHVPVILLSQRGDESAVSRGLELGASGAVSKYENLRELPGLVGRTVSAARPAGCC